MANEISIEDQVLFAKAAYAAYGRTTGNRNYQGLPMPEWDALTPTIRSAWMSAAEAVRNHMSVTFNWYNAMSGDDPNLVVKYRP